MHVPPIQRSAVSKSASSAPAKSAAPWASYGPTPDTKCCCRRVTPSSSKDWRNVSARKRAGFPLEAAAFGEVVLISVPYGALPQVGRDYATELKGKVVLDTGNPFPDRDGDMAIPARKKGTGVASAEFLPGVRLVRAFNSIPHFSLRSEAHRKGERVAVPLAGDDAVALKIAVRLVEDAGFEPVIVGPLARAREFDAGTAVFGKALTARELRRSLGLDS
jgi:predicted dinucleotide-binding enzyme